MSNETIRLDEEVLCNNCNKLTNFLLEIPAHNKTGGFSGKPCATIILCCPNCRNVLGISRVFDWMILDEVDIGNYVL